MFLTLPPFSQLYQCPPGTADVDSNPATPCVPCVVGLQYQDTSASLSCKNVSQCAAGYQQLAAPTALADRVCTQCQAGTYKAVVSSSIACSPVSNCGPGQQQLQAPTMTSDRVRDSMGSSRITQLMSLLPPLSPQVCESCVNGSTWKSASGQAVPCQNVTVCPAGTTQLQGVWQE